MSNVVKYNLLGEDESEFTSGYWEAISDVRLRSAPNGSVVPSLYEQTITGVGKTKQEAVKNLGFALRTCGHSGGVLRRV